MRSQRQAATCRAEIVQAAQPEHSGWHSGVVTRSCPQVHSILTLSLCVEREFARRTLLQLTCGPRRQVRGHCRVIFFVERSRRANPKSIFSRTTRQPAAIGGVPVADAMERKFNAAQSGYSVARSLYGVLGVSPLAGEGEIKAAFRKLAKRFHPDLHVGTRGRSSNSKRSMRPMRPERSTRPRDI